MGSVLVFFFFRLGPSSSCSAGSCVWVLGVTVVNLASLTQYCAKQKACDESK